MELPEAAERQSLGPHFSSHHHDQDMLSVEPQTLGSVEAPASETEVVGRQLPGLVGLHPLEQ